MNNAKIISITSLVFLFIFNIHVQASGFNWQFDYNASSNLSCIKVLKSKEYDKAFKCFDERAKSTNDGRDQYNLSIMYYNGKGIKQNYTHAFSWLLKAANNKHVKSYSKLATMYYQGKGTTKNTLEAYKWFLKAANHGHINSQVNIAYFYENGIAVSRNLKKSLSWYEKAANSGDVSSATKVGSFNLAGLGTIKNIDKALEFLQIGAKKGNTAAERMLAQIYLFEQARINTRKGMYFLEKAVNKKDPQAIYMYALLNFNGKVIKQNIQDAYFYATIAKDLGAKPASQIIETIENKISPEDLRRLKASNAKARIEIGM